MSKFPREFLERTIGVWQQYTPEHLSLRDARETAENMTDLFSLLSEWKEKDDGKEKRHESIVIKTKK